MLCLTLMLVALQFAVGARNNVCTTFGGYFAIDISPKCSYNPDVTANAYQLILQRHYQLEVYQSITNDLYIITTLRIPPKNSTTKGVVLLIHPALSSYTVWLDLGRESLAFILADAGYDVWLADLRGTLYSEQHACIPTNTNRYWNSSFHEMGIYDVPVQVDLVRETTSRTRKVIVIGHSLGTTVSYVYSSMLPEYAQENIEAFISYAPIAKLGHVTSPIALVAPFEGKIMTLATIFHELDFVPYYSLTHYLFELFCAQIALTIKPCSDLVQLLVGHDPDHLAPENMPLIVYQNFAGMPLKVISHYAQIIQAKGRFQQYDYGSSLNRYYYHSNKPPAYPIDRIAVRTYLVYGGKDSLGTEKDAYALYGSIPEQSRGGIFKIETFNHVDFLYARNVSTIAYEPTLTLIRQITSRSDVQK